MHPLAEAQERAESVSFTEEENQKIREFKIPGDADPRQNQLYFPRKPTEDVARWRNEHRAKLRDLERAAGMSSGRGRW